jgi:crotonobetainyl-CoA:carnitine CoA-transferase CaiB-like acyl-CoA transferase
MQASACCLPALLEREIDDQGRTVRATHLRGAVAWLGSSWTWAERPIPMLQGYLPKDLRFPLVECKDGGWIVYTSTVRAIPTPSTVARDHPVGRIRGRAEASCAWRTFFGDVPSVTAKARGWTSPELLDLFVEAGVACDPVLDPTECWDDPQLRQNGMIRSTPSGTECVGNPIHWDSTLGTSNGGGGSEGKKRD